MTVRNWGPPVRWGDGHDLTGLGFPICKAEGVLRRMRQYRTSPKPWGVVCAPEMLGALMIIVVVVVIIVLW